MHLEKDDGGKDRNVRVRRQDAAEHIEFVLEFSDVQHVENLHAKPIASPQRKAEQIWTTSLEAYVNIHHLDPVHALL